MAACRTLLVSPCATLMKWRTPPGSPAQTNEGHEGKRPQTRGPGGGPCQCVRSCAPPLCQPETPAISSTLSPAPCGKRGPFAKPHAWVRSPAHIAHRGCATCPGVCDRCNAISSVWHIYYTTWHGSCNSTYHARHASLPAMPTLRRLRGRDPPSSTTLPPLGTRGLRASPDPGRVPLLILNLMRYARDMAFGNVARNLSGYPYSSTPSPTPVYRVSVVSTQQVE